MIGWILLAAVIAKVLGKKLQEWADDPDVRKEWAELIETIDDAYKDGKITLPEIARIAKEAADVVKEILE